MTIDRLSFAIFASRILGIIVLIRLLDHFVAIPLPWLYQNAVVNTLDIVIFAISFFFYFALSYFLLAHAKTVGRFLISDAKEDPSDVVLDGQAIQTTGFILLGAYTAVTHFAAVLNILLLEVRGIALTVQMHYGLIISGVEFLVGLALVIYRRELVRFINRRHH